MTALLRDRTRLRAKLDELSARAAAGELAARRAAAEACVRLAIVEPGDARALLRRAVELDPYRAEAWLLLGRCDREAGAYELARERLETAAAVAPEASGERPLLLVERARVAIGLARTERAAHRADEAVAMLDPLFERTGDPEVLLVLIEALVHGSANALRERMPALLARIEPARSSIDARRLARVLYLVVLSIGVDRNILDAVERVAAGLPGVVAAVTAKRATAQELCARIDSFARDIDDPRIVRLLLRERLATVDEPAQRRALFEQVMNRIGSLDGIVYDYLQLQHLVAKRAVATGDAAAARTAWESCLVRDPDNLAAALNLARLANASGDRATAAGLRERIHELRVVYVTHGPRPDRVIEHAIAPLRAQLERGLETGEDSLAKTKAPKLERIAELTRVLARVTALLRLAHEPKVRRAIPAATTSALLDLDRADVFELAAEVIARPIFEELPLAYAYLDLPKHATVDAINAMASAGDDAPPMWQTRVAMETAVLHEPERRAAYDARTADATTSETLRAHVRMVVALLDAVGRSAGDAAVREALVSSLRELVPPVVAPYLEIAMRVPAGLAHDAFANVILAGPLEQARAYVAAGRVEAALDLLKQQASVGGESSGWLAAMALYSAGDPRVTIDVAAEAARTFARRANSLAGGAHPDPAIRTLAAGAEPVFRQLVACERASALLARNKERGALDALWWGHPAGLDRMAQTNPPVDAWRDIDVDGEARYKLTVARAMRQSTTVWSTSQRMLMHTKFEDLNLRRIVLLAQRLAYWWAMSGRTAAAAANSPELLVQADALLKGLEADRIANAELAA